MIRSLNLKAAPLKNPLCVALDVDTESQAFSLVDQLQDVVGGFKIGPRLLLKYGESFAQKVAQAAPLFVDCKFFDIPSTMEASVKASFEMGASLVTVHALAGAEALSRLSQLESELSKQRPFRILAVTVLTSWDQKSVPHNLKPQSISDHVLNLAQLCESSGIRGLVCSAEEIALLKNENRYLLTPGIRFSLEDHADQKRVMAPHEAIKAGSSALVVGRPIIHSKSPRETAMDYLTAIYE
jgi:orotidine-5'-phosphate decarboxylase